MSSKRGKRGEPSAGRVPACLHCGSTQWKKRRRGLCWVCYGTEAIRFRYPERKRGSALNPDDCDLVNGHDINGQAEPWPGPLPPLGTEARIEALARRAAAHQELFPPLGGVLDPAALKALAHLAGMNGAAGRKEI